MCWIIFKAPTITPSINKEPMNLLNNVKIKIILSLNITLSTTYYFKVNGSRSFTSKTWTNISSFNLIRGHPKWRCSHDHSYMGGIMISNQLKYCSKNTNTKNLVYCLTCKNNKHHPICFIFSKLAWRSYIYKYKRMSKPQLYGGMKSKSFKNGRYNNGTHIPLRSVKSLLLNIWSIPTQQKNNLKSILYQLIY